MEENQQNTHLLMVSIRCAVFNHEPYLRQCLDGFLMQKTSFRFEAIVHDDASTDGSADIIREYADKYPDTIKPIYETENQYSKHDGSLQKILSEACTGKYIALCEGDDYWTDPLKLQREIDFLEKRPNYVAVAENAIVNNSITNSDYLFSNEESRDLTVKEMIIRRRFATASVVYRRDVYVKITDVTNILYDTMTWCFLCSQGKFRYNNIVSSVYRRGMQGITEYTDKYVWATIVERWNTELRRLFCPKYIDNETIDKIIWNQYRIPFECGKRKTKLPAILKMYKYGSFLTTSKYLFKYICRRITRLNF